MIGGTVNLASRLEHEAPPGGILISFETHAQVQDQIRCEERGPRKEILLDYRNILEKAYEPEAFAGRLQQLAKLLDNSSRKRQGTAGDARRGFQSKVQQIINSLPGAQDQFRKILIQCATENPNSLRTIVTLMAFYLHLGPFSRHVIEQIAVGRTSHPETEDPAVAEGLVNLAEDLATLRRYPALEVLHPGLRNELHALQVGQRGSPSQQMALPSTVMDMPDSKRVKRYWCISVPRTSSFSTILKVRATITWWKA